MVLPAGKDGGQIRLTARHFGLSPDTVSRWWRAYQAHGVPGLEPRSRRPKRVRQPSTPPEVVARIQALREQEPRWGREKPRVLLAREGIQVSAKTIDGVLARLRARGALVEPAPRRPARKPRQGVLRRPKDLVVDAPGVLVQLDTKAVALECGRTVYEFAAVDSFTRKRVVALAAGRRSQLGAAFLQRLVAQFPFPVQAVQTDGGSEFLGAFRQTARALGLVHDVNHPSHPQGNGRVERSFRTDEEEFYQVEELPKDLPALAAALAAWNAVYEAVRPHQALGYLTPDEFYARWLTEQQPRKEQVSDMS